MLAGAVDAGEGLFVQQAGEAVLRGHTLHDLHGELVVVGGDVGGGVDGGQLVLRGGDLVMLCFGQHAELPQLPVQIGHVRGHAGFDGAEVMVVELLPLGRTGAEQRAAREHEILALVEQRLVHEEVFLLRAGAGAHALDGVVSEQAQDTQGLLVERLHGAQQRRFLVQRFAAVGAEGRGDAQGLVLDEGIAGGVPGGVAARFKRGP